MTRWWIGLALVLATLAVYAPAGNFGYVNFDDPFYLAENRHVRGGLTASNVMWALTSAEGANWFPVTRLSELLDTELFGMAPGPRHLMNAAIHAAAVLLLFAFLLRATSRLWPSAFVAAVFGLHPLHVESVAWLSERKDVLSALFAFLTLWLWAGGRRRWAVASFALGLLSKPMLVTLPLLLLLLDEWPLGSHSRAGWTSRVREKLPLIALAVASAAVTFVVQQAGQAVRTAEAFPLAARLQNAVVSCVAYLAKTLWPTHLAAFYPYPQSIPSEQWLGALAVLIAMTAAVVRWRTRWPWLLTGWGWFLVSLLPVIGIVQVGAQARADRYMYLPMVGLAIMAAYFEDVSRPAIVIAVALLCAALTLRQAAHWRDSETLWRHALAVTEANYFAEHNLGAALLETPGREAEAIAHLESSLRIKPDSASVHTDLGTAYTHLPDGRDRAIAQYRAALRIDPSLAIPRSNLCAALGDVAECEAAVRATPDSPDARNNLGAALAKAGRQPEAAAEFEVALRLRPDYSEARANLQRLQSSPADLEFQQGLSLARAGRLADAVIHFEAALRLDPKHAEAHNNLGFALVQLPGRTAEAMQHFEAALRLNPGYADAHYNLGVALSEMPGRLPEAIRHLEAAQRLRPDPQLAEALRRLTSSPAERR